MYNLATYIGDAQVMQLPLVSIGGGDAYHDWEYLLVHLGLIEHDAKIAAMTRGLGIGRAAGVVELGRVGVLSNAAKTGCRHK